MEMCLNLNDIAEVWLDILLHSEALDDFCRSHFQKPCKFFMGADPKHPPQDTDAPLIMIITGDKEEWMEPENVYTLYIMAGIVEKRKEADGKLEYRNEDARVIRICGQSEINEFSHLILTELQSRLEYPMHASVDTSPSTDFPQFGAFMKITTTIEPAMGEELKYRAIDV